MSAQPIHHHGHHANTPWDDLPTTERAAYITRNLTIIKKAWPHLNDPPNPPTTGPRPHPASRTPTNLNALSLRVEIIDDLAYWAHELYADRPESRDPKKPIDLLDPATLLALLAANATWIAGWAYGKRFAFELADHAHDAKHLAWPDRTDTVKIGTCPNTIGVDGTPTECGTTIRAKRRDPGQIKCKGCGLTDTVDGWLLRIVGTERPVTAEQLVPILHARLGVRIQRATIRKWKARGLLVPIGTERRTDGQTVDLFDRRDALTLVTLHDIRSTR